MIKLFCDRCGAEIGKEERSHFQGEDGRWHDIGWAQATHAYSLIRETICGECAKREASEIFQRAIANAAEKSK